ncbi:MAG: hypothetical protein LBR46_08570 [Prevotella sp.]|jgi:hypothetical protein|nr:hypothetical protein [Prevotella sp.]
MEKVYVTVGYFDTIFPEDECIIMNFSKMPNIGDLIIPNGKLKSMIQKKKEIWKLAEGVRINYVVSIAYSDWADLPIIILGGHQASSAVDFIYNNNVIAGYLKRLPRIGDYISIKEFSENLLYVHEIAHDVNSNVIAIFVGETPKTIIHDVYITNTSISTSINNPYPILIEWDSGYPPYVRIYNQ